MFRPGPKGRATSTRLPVAPLCPPTAPRGRYTPPIEHLRNVNARVDRRRNRRSLEPDELKRLLKATTEGPVRYGMSGHERYLLYRFAAETGLRANEIRSLTVRDFDFEHLTVTVKAGHSKRRREDTLPLRPDTVQLLRDFFAEKLPTAKAFGGTYKRLTKRTADMLEGNRPAKYIE